MADAGYGRSRAGYGGWGIARTYALIFGLAYVAVALLEVLVGRDDGLRLGGNLILKFALVQNLVHWAVGVVVLGSFFAGEVSARVVARVVGIVFVVITVWGFIDRDSLGNVLGYGITLPQAYNWIHLITAVLALIAGFAGERAYGRRGVTT